MSVLGAAGLVPQGEISVSGFVNVDNSVFSAGLSAGLVITTTGSVPQGTYLFQIGSTFSQKTCEEDPSK